MYVRTILYSNKQRKTENLLCLLPPSFPPHQDVHIITAVCSVDMYNMYALLLYV